MAFTRRDIRGGAIQTTITAGITNASTSCAIAASTGWPDGATYAAFYVVIDPGLATEEKVLCSTRSTLTVNFTTRGVDGTTAAAHASGAAIYPCVTAVDLDEANNAASQTVGAVTTKGDILAATGSQAVVRVAAGTNGLPLTADSAQTAGVAYAALTAGGLASGSVTTAKIAAGAVTATELGTGAVTSTKILDGTIATGDIAALAITTALIAAAAVDENKLAASVAGAGITGGAGTALAVGVDGSTIEITTDALNVKGGGIGATQLASNAVTTVKITDANVTAAKLEAAIPRGVVSQATVTTGQGSIQSTDVDLTSLAVTLTGDGVRRFRLTARIEISSDTQNDIPVLKIKEGSTQINRFIGWSMVQNIDVTIILIHEFVPSAASHTYKLSAARAVGSGILSMDTDSTRPCFFMAEDIGV